MKPNILLIYNHFLPAWKAGGPIRSIAELVNQLHEQYQFYILCSGTEYGEKNPLNAVLTDQWVDWEKKAKVYYAYHQSVTNIFLNNIFDEINPEVVFVNGLFSYGYNIYPLFAALRWKKNHPDFKIILSPRGMLHPGALSQKKVKKRFYFIFFKLLNLQNKVCWHATDEKEVHFIRNKFKNAHIAIAGNFPKLSSQIPSPAKEHGKLIMGTLALISPMKNHLEILKALKSVTQEVVWHIYGPVKNHAYWDLCSNLVKELPSNIQVIYHGAILPEQISLALRDIQIFILPSKSENFGHSICEAMSAGRPVITTDTTPYLNLQQFRAGYTINYHQLNEELSKAIRFFADMDANEFNMYTENAINNIHKKMDLQKIKLQYQKLFSIA